LWFYILGADYVDCKSYYVTDCGCFGEKKIVVLYGPRQVGKTTLIKQILAWLSQSRYVTCDDPHTRNLFTNPSLATLTQMLKSYRYLVLDEAQRVENIGMTLKLIIDNIPDIQVIATGSSSFELANTISEPLTWRTITFYLYPLSWWELMSSYDPIARRSLLEQSLIYGLYPDVFLWSSESYLKELVDSYLYKDILEHQRIKKSHVLMTLLQVIALQIGSEVSYHELSQIVGIDHTTVEKYITILEQSFIIFRLPCFSRNLRNELKKAKKIYFWDVWVRNALLNAFNPLHVRNDVGALWENFCIVERIKYLHYTKTHKNLFFWRTKEQQEIDLVEEANMMLDCYECKRSVSKASSLPRPFVQAYPDHTYTIINPDTFEHFVS